MQHAAVFRGALQQEKGLDVSQCCRKTHRGVNQYSVQLSVPLCSHNALTFSSDSFSTGSWFHRGVVTLRREINTLKNRSCNSLCGKILFGSFEVKGGCTVYCAVLMYLLTSAIFSISSWLPSTGIASEPAPSSTEGVYLDLKRNPRSSGEKAIMLQKSFYAWLRKREAVMKRWL